MNERVRIVKIFESVALLMMLHPQRWLRDRLPATAIAVTTLLVAVPASSHAASLVSDRVALQSNDQVDWSSLGFTPPF
jgi:hypothetical protein